VSSVTPQEDLLSAQSKMRAHDYSQLAVMNGPRHLVGAISWESIAKALLRNTQASLAECIDTNHEPVRVDQPLLDAVPAIAKAGFVFVKDTHNSIAGIVTVADLAEQFAGLTRPFLLIEEIERLLRTAVDRCFTSEELYESLDPDDDRDVAGAHSLSLGEVQRLLESPDKFAGLGWEADRRVFISNLEGVRMIRNDVMHFSPDPISEKDVALLKDFVVWVRSLEEGI